MFGLGVAWIHAYTQKPIRVRFSVRVRVRIGVRATVTVRRLGLA